MKRSFIASCVALALAACAAMANAQQTVILVRHAELQSAGMAGPKSLALSETGAARAKQLASVLKDAGIDAIYVTDFVRTQKTAEPLSRELHRQPTVIPKGNARELLERIRQHPEAHAVLLVGHSDTLPGLLKALGHPDDVKIDAQDFGNLFVVVTKHEGAPTFLRLRY